MFIVIYYDDDCLCIPQSWDKDCDGAICSGNLDDAVAVLDSIEFCYEFVSSTDCSKTLLYTINLKQIERDRTSSSQKVQEVIEIVRSDLLREDNEDETK